MKKIKKEVEVIACEICGEEISPQMPLIAEENELGYSEPTLYHFHRECVNKLLIEKAKEII